MQDNYIVPKFGILSIGPSFSCGTASHFYSRRNSKTEEFNLMPSHKV